MVRGPSPGPAPAAQAAGPGNSRLTRFQLADMAPPEAAQKGPQGGWRLDHAAYGTSRPEIGAATRRRRQCSLLRPEQNATSVITLSPVLARPGAQTQVQAPERTSCGTRPRCKASVAGRSSPAPSATRRLVCQRRFGCGRGGQSASIFWVLLAWGRFPVSKAIIPDAQEHSSYPFSTPRHSSFRWIPG